MTVTDAVVPPIVLDPEHFDLGSTETSRRALAKVLTAGVDRLTESDVDPVAVAEAVAAGLSGCFGDVERRSDEPWPTPTPLAVPLPSLPVDVLPGTLKEIVEAVAASTQTPPDLAAFSALAVLSAATRGNWEIVVKPGWEEQTALYLTALSDSGTRKSAVVRAVGGPLYAQEKAIRIAGRGEYLEASAAYRILEKRAKAAEDSAAKPKAAPEDEANARDLARQFGEAVRPAEFRLLTDDTTPEKLAMMMDSQGGPMAVLTAEGGLLGTLAGRYSDTANVDLVLKAFNAEPVRVDRVSRESLDIERPFLALGLVVQPDVIDQAATVPEFTRRGLLPRMLFARPMTTVGKRGLDAPAVPAEVTERWSRCVADVLKHAVSDSRAPARLQLDAEALAVLDEFRVELEPRMDPESGDLARVVAWASKLPGALVRIAALFALADDAGTHWVRGEYVRAAVGLATYLIAHASAVLALDSQRRDARQVAALAWIGRWVSPKHPQPMHGSSSGGAFTARDAWQGVRGQAWAETAADVQAVLEQLDEMGWIRRRPDPPRTGGRPPSPVYDVHPVVANASPKHPQHGKEISE